jgi:hypothetical protein
LNEADKIIRLNLGSENRIILQPITSAQAALMSPSLITELAEMESTQAYDEFNSFTTKLPGTDELTLAKKNCIKLLKEHWSNVSPFHTHNQLSCSIKTMTGF